MIYIDRYELINSKHIELDEEYTLDENQLKHIHGLIEFKKAKVHVVADYISNLAIIKVEVKGAMVLQSSRTLKPVPFHFDENDELTYSFIKENELMDENVILCEKEKIDLDEEVFSLIITSIPIKVVGKDEPECIYGDSWEIISEEEYKKKKAARIDPRFKDLDDFFKK